MRGTIRSFSVLAPIITLFFGTIFSFLGSFGFDMWVPYYELVPIIVTSVGLTPGVTLALIGLIMSIRGERRNCRGLWFWGQLIWPLIIILFALLFFYNTTLGPFWWTVVSVLSLPSLLYGFLAPQQAPPVPRQGQRQVLFIAILSAAVIAGIIMLLLSPFVRALQEPPAPSVLTASAASPYADCAHGTYPLVILQNPSAVAVTWSAKSITDDNAPLTFTPAHGTLAAHGTVEVKISGNTTKPVVNVQFDDSSGASSTMVKLLCGLGK